MEASRVLAVHARLDGMRVFHIKYESIFIPVKRPQFLFNRCMCPTDIILKETFI